MTHHRSRQFLLFLPPLLLTFLLVGCLMSRGLSFSFSLARASAFAFSSALRSISRKSAHSTSFSSTQSSSLALGLEYPANRFSRNRRVWGMLYGKECVRPPIVAAITQWRVRKPRDVAKRIIPLRWQQRASLVAPSCLTLLRLHHPAFAFRAAPRSSGDSNLYDPARTMLLWCCSDVRLETLRTVVVRLCIARERSLGHSVGNIKISK